MEATWSQATLQNVSQSYDDDDDGGGDDGVTTTPESAATTDAAPEPEPGGMDPAVWGVWWPVHRYGFGSLFVVLCAYALYATVLRACRNRAVGGGARSRRAVQPVFTAINALVFLLGLSNAVMLLADPYCLFGRVPLLLAVLLLNTPYPCMTSAFALVNWVLLSISRMRMTRASRLRSAWFLALVILAHFGLILAACLVLVLYSSVLVLGILCHGFFVVFGAVLCVAYVYSAWKIIGAERHNRRTLYDISTRDGGGSSVAGSPNGVGGSVLGSRASLSARIPRRLASAIGRGKAPARRAPTSTGESLDSSTTKIYSIGEEEGLQPAAVPAPPFVEDGGQEGAVAAQIRDTADEKQLLSDDSSNGNGIAPPKHYSNAGADGEEGHTPTGTGPRNGAPARGNGAPANGNGEPANGNGAPANGNGAPAIGNGAPAIGNGTPANGNGASATGNGAPANGHGTPAKSPHHETHSSRSTGCNKARGSSRGTRATQSTGQRAKVDRQSGGKISGTGRPQKCTQKVFRIAAITAALGLGASALGLYGILGLMVAEAADQPSPWGWFAFQTCSRLVELGMGCTMAYFTTQPFPRRRQR